MRDPKGQVRIDVSVITEETARSPQGVWYATRIRRHVPREGAAQDETRSMSFMLTSTWISPIPCLSRPNRGESTDKIE